MKKLRPTSLAALALLAGMSSTSAMADERRGYIVRLADEPALSYAGGLSGLAATQPAEGRRFVFQAAEVQAYVRYLKVRQRAVTGLLGKAPVYASYTTVLNGFAARLTDAEVLALQANPAVRSVQVDEIRHVATPTTPRFLGLSEPGGLWSQTVAGGLDKGEDIVIGVIDTGVWPENPAFADRVDASGAPTFSGGTLAYGPPPASFTGGCVAGEGFDPVKHCNNKLIGAKVFNAAMFAESGSTLHWSEFNSPRDSLGDPVGHGGHGTHTASTAGGNSGVPAFVNGIPMGNASGMAPRARIAVYKVCNTFVSDTSASGQNACFTSDSVAAIEEAVKDGVNVINFSISGTQTTVNDAVEQAFLKASNAGIFVSAAAGNSGPDNQVNHPSPWLATIAASSHDRLYKADLQLGNGAKYSGASMNLTALPAKPLILSINAALPGADLGLANLCYLKGADGNPLLDPAKVQGRIVVCSRGTNPRVEKSQAVAEAGGVGMILSDDGNGLVAEAHAVPTIHVSQADGGAIKAHAASGGGSSTLGAFYAGTKPAPVMAAFSSRGPNMADANVLKPDFTAPGVDVIAGATPVLTEAQRNAVAAGTLVPQAAWVSMQGTSMATPHITGLAALLKQAHPGWSPAAIRSALATTTRSTLDDGLAGMQNGLLPWARGTGHVQPNQASDPGLVFDAGKADWIRYQCTVMKASMPAEDCANYGSLDATYNLNLPSITVANLPGSVTVTRTVTNVSATTSTYTATASLPNFNVQVVPASLTLAPGESRSFTVTIANVDALDGVWKYGSLVWRDGGNHVVSSPISVKMGKSIVIAEQVIGNTASGSRLLTARTGFAGRMGVGKSSLKDVSMGPLTLLAPYKYSTLGIAQACQGGGSYFVEPYDVVIPAGTIVARFALRQQDVGTANDDHDLLVLDPNGKAYISGNAGSNESVLLTNPLAGNWRVCVGAYSGGINGGMSHRLSSWIVGPNDADAKLNVLVPGQVYAGGTGTVGISWSGVPAGKRYVGGAVFKDAGGVIQAGTAVIVETDSGVPQSDEPRVLTSQDLKTPQ